MQLQVAMDDSRSMQELVMLAEAVKESVDILEVGTPALMKFGLEAVHVLHKKYADGKIRILADTKIIDAGYWETEMAVQAGADVVTVLGVAGDITIRQCLQAARDLDAEIMIDMIAVQNIEERISELEEMGVHYICLHHSKDMQNEHKDFKGYFSRLQKQVRKSRLAVAGGICKENVSYFVDMHPEIIVVGGGICKMENPGETANCIKSVFV